VQTDRLTFNRWLARDYTLHVSVPAAVGASGPVPLTYYYPYSGQTPPNGVTAKLVDLGIYPPAVSGTSGSGYTTAFWAPAKGAIALVRTAPPVFSLDTGQTATGGYEPGKSSAQAALDYTSYAAALPHPAWQGIFEPVSLLDARDAGARNDATSVWMLDHPGIYRAATLGVTAEHLGATRWADVAGQYVATGGFEWSTTYTLPHNPLNVASAEQHAYLSAAAAVNASGWPDYPIATVRPGVLPVYLGEGAPLYTAGLGTVSHCPLPTYLLQAGDAQRPDLLDLDKLDKNLMYGQILTLARTIQALDATPPAAL